MMNIYVTQYFAQADLKDWKSRKINTHTNLTTPHYKLHKKYYAMQ